MKNIVENNKLIAEFLGEIKQPFEFPQFGYINIMGDWKDTFFDNQLKFHTDWNWLMKVVEKCLVGEAEYDEDEAKKAIHEIYESLCNINITSVYNACVKFIKWYNSHLCANCGRFDDVVGTHSITICEECALNNTVL